MRLNVAMAAFIAVAAPAAAAAQTPVQPQRPAQAQSPQAHQSAPAQQHAQQAVQTPLAGAAQTIIEPRNELERALMTATDVGAGEEERAAFRRIFLESQVALALAATDPAAPPRQIHPRGGVDVCLIFTSSARATEVMGDEAARVMLTGREALERVRGANLVININLRPFITLDAEGVEGFLALPDEPAPPAQREAAPRPNDSTGPTQ